jgi:ferrous iron transport protein B
MQRPFTIALVGNPNSGKSSLFNALTGLNQRVGNFPGVTVDKKTGISRISEQLTAHIIDLPGTYSLYPKSADEQVTYEVLLNRNNADRPDLIVVIADASNLKRNLLFCSQIMDLGVPVIMALTMNDIARRKGIVIDTEGLERLMAVPVVPINPRRNKGIPQLKKVIADVKQAGMVHTADFIDAKAIAGNWLEDIKQLCGLESDYSALHVACNHQELGYLNAAQRIRISALIDEVKFHKAKVQAEEIMQRYRRISSIMQQCVMEESPLRRSIISERIDKILLHPLWGNIILLVVLFFLFQSIFWLAAYPMDWVEQGFAVAGQWLGGILPDGFIKDLLINGLLAGIGGIAIFIPQIMILFGFITVLEDSGYMARISFLTDRLMRSVGLNGRSVMPLISGMACAVPAIMAARTIQNRKERLITIMVTPLMSCSARLPVYTILIGLVVPSKSLGIFNLQGLVLMGLYLLGFFMALFVAWIMDFLVKTTERTYFLMELPVYRAPRWKNVGITMIEKAKLFVTDAGKVIMVISLLLWGLATFGPPQRMAAVDAKYALLKEQYPDKSQAFEKAYQTEKLEHSFAGIMGHAIEPGIRPLGFDWKIGIALITSFAAREVFVGTMATLYSVGNDDNVDATLREKMRMAKRADGSPVYTLATGLSLLIFYVFAMQCMSTMAIVKRETGTWKMPVIQFIYMFVLAYFSSLFVYQLLS